MAKKDIPKDVDLAELINAQFGDGALLPMSGETKAYDVFSTGCLGLDAALGVGGLPRGRIVELYGPESSGKTTIALQIIASAMDAGHKCAFVDAEHALDMRYAEALGVDLKRLYVSQPSSGEQALDICDTLVRSGQCAVVVVDSVAALTPQAELEGEMGDAQVGAQARMMGKALRKLVASVSTTDTLLIFINQTRMKIGVMYGSPETTSGGNALKFFASIRMRIKRTGSNKDKAGDEGVAVSNKTNVKVVKNKCAPPFREANFEIEFGEGVSQYGEVLDLAVQYKLVKKAGAYFKLASDDSSLGQGREKVKAFLAANPRVYLRLRSLVKQKLGLGDGMLADVIDTRCATCGLELGDGDKQCFESGGIACQARARRSKGGA